MRNTDKIIYNTGQSLVPSGTALVTLYDYISGKTDDIHNQMYEAALAKYLELHPEMTTYSYKEIQNKDWKSPSTVLFISNEYPFHKKKVNLKDWWDDSSYFITNISNSWTESVVDEDSIKDAEIIDIDYVNGKVTLESKLTQNKWQVPFNKINENTPLSDDKCTLNGTFLSMIKQR